MFAALEGLDLCLMLGLTMFTVPAFMGVAVLICHLVGGERCWGDE
jgi:hypothetical protein